MLRSLYFDSMYESNAKLVKQVFHPIAKITGYVEDKLEEMDTNQFAKFVGEQKPSPSDKNDPKKLETCINNDSRKNCCYTCQR